MEGCFYEPSKRYLHCSALVGERWYTYGGKLENPHGQNPSVVEEFDPTQKVWKQHQTFGETPPGYIGSAAASIRSKFYVFGGLNEKDYFNSLHELDVKNFEWSKLEPRNVDGVCPIPKIGAGMVSFDNRFLVIYGGRGVSRFHVQKHALYVRSSGCADGDLVWTNELLCFNIDTREWHIPSIIGDQPTACAGCSLTKVDYFRAILFGGHGVGDICVPNYVRILNMSKNDQWRWTVVKPNFMAIKEKRWPEIRSWHSAVSLCVVSDNKDESPPNPRLMIVFGRNNKDLNLKDAWIYTVNSMEWALGDFPESLITTTAASVRSSTCMMYHEPFSTQKTLVQFGGIIPEVKCDHPYPSNPTTLFTLNLLPDHDLKTVCAKHLKAGWVSIRPEYPQLSLGEERRQLFHTSTREQIMDNSDIGISIKRVYDDDDHLRSTEVTVHPCFNGPFKFPREYDQASPVYISTETNSSMRSTTSITINHYASVETEEDCRSMAFLRGQSVPRKEKSQFVYEFHAIHGDASFAVGKNTGEITVNELAPICIAKRQTPRGRNKILYGLKVYYATPTPINGSCGAILSMFLYQNLYLTALSSYIKQNYPLLTQEMSKLAVSFKNEVTGNTESDDNNLKVKFLCFPERDWRVTGNINPKVIFKDEVDLPTLIDDIQLEQNQEYPPKIRLNFDTEESVAPSTCVIEVVGLEQQFSFNIPLYLKTPITEEKTKQVITNDQYLCMLINVLDQAATKWKEIGLNLGFSSDDLNCIEQDPSLVMKGVKAYFQELLRQWLEWKPQDDHLPTITALYDALKSPLVNELVLAEELLRKVKEVTDQSLSTLKDNYEPLVDDAIEKFGVSMRLWEENGVTKISVDVAKLMKQMMLNLQKPDKMCSITEEIEKSCKSLAEEAQDMITECTIGIKTKSELLKKYAQIHHRSSIVVDLEQMIRGMIDLADSMKQFWESVNSAIKHISHSSKENQWKKTSLKRQKSQTFSVGYVGAISQHLESHAASHRHHSAYEPTADYSD